MPLKVPFNLDPTEVAEFEFRFKTKLPGFGNELFEIKLSGFTDDDGDGNPEFAYDVEVFDKDVVDPGKVEIPAATMAKGLGAIIGPAVSAIVKVNTGLRGK